MSRGEGVGDDSLSEPSGILWADLPPIPEGLLHTLAESDVHLWLIRLQVPEEALSNCSALLSPDEIARAERFRFPHLRSSYTVGRGASRRILGSYLNAPAETLRFQYSPRGKPSLNPEANPLGLTFNISHSQGLAILAIARGCSIGVDLEYREQKQDLHQIADRNFSPAEATALFSVPGDQRTDAFYACWTLKEAYLKATGDGLSTPLDGFDVTFPPAAPSSIARIASSPDEHLRWQALSLTLDDHAAAIVVEGPEQCIRRGIWLPQTGHTA